ncbi:cytochrome c oxidase subunit 3 [Flagellimonas pacifica]|uniref:Nitric oxide reductase NorE protein n=1 Tax=Flagellimonas pacifica TaxID=1247520 RepID=A0A285MY34_9FLAO|nr:cytochrome c oxidase subunit 3 [Allomuricauda parva]SNZ01457.1 nitric oxide reductase NorE protein [Allomuricauda parva]
MNQEAVDHKNIFFPPGGILLWIIIFLELMTFGVALVIMVYESKAEPVQFHDSRLLLNVTYGMINTIFLLTSGFFMALSVKEMNFYGKQRLKKYLPATILFGSLFLLLKSVEYYEKIEAGLGMGHSTFFNYYWMLTLFHVIHVIVGLIILISVYVGIKKESTTIEDIEASAAFWHMCDLIWLLLFPMLYLLF